MGYECQAAAASRLGLTIQQRQHIVSTMRPTVTLDDDVYEAAQARARATGKRFGRVLSEIARQALQPTGRPPRQEDTRFPTFKVSAGARPIPAGRIQKVLDEDAIV